MKYNSCLQTTTNRKFSEKVFYIFQFIFVLTTFNRELLFLGLDFRYIGIFLEVFLIVTKLYKTKFTVVVNRIDKLFFLFYTFVSISNISWIWNGLEPYPELIFNLAVLNLYNFLAFLTFNLYKESFDEGKLYKLILFSGIVLCISIFWIYSGNEFPTFISKAERTMTQDVGLGEHHNLFGQPIRVAGLAEDANYATLFCVISAATAFYCIRKKSFKVVFILFFSLGAALAFSRTVLLGALVSVVLLSIRKFIPKTDAIVYSSFVYGALIGSVILPFLGIENVLQTVATRFNFWRHAAELFWKNPIIGNGLASFRHYQSSLYNNTWYVQTHNTWWQLLSEHGLIATFIITLLVIYLLRINSVYKNNYNKFIITLMIIFFCSFETIYLQIFILVFYALNISNKRMK